MCLFPRSERPRRPKLPQRYMKKTEKAQQNAIKNREKSKKMTKSKKNQSFCFVHLIKSRNFALAFSTWKHQR